MPQIKIEHVLSFSSEDNVHAANNLLNTDTRTKWICKTPGEPSATIVLQLGKATKISGIDIGNEKSCFIEVLVGRTGFQDLDYEVLLAMSSFMTPTESINLTNINRVRFFANQDLVSPARDEKWDRIKVVCTQPYNKTVQYGLAMFVLHEDTSDRPSDQLGKFTLRPNSPDTIRVGSLFERRKELATKPKLTLAQEFRRAPSFHWIGQKAFPGCDAANIKPSTGQSSTQTSTTQKNRNRKDLFYDSEDDEPHEKIDRIMKKIEALQKKGDGKNTPVKNKPTRISTPKTKDEVPSTSAQIKPKVEESAAKKMKLQLKPFSEMLKDVVFVISGIENPERQTLRNKAIEMGATYKVNWDRSCTHLICAFVNSPKFRQAKGQGKIVKKEWLCDCSSQRKRLPWRRYALDRNDQGKPESEDEIGELKSSVQSKLETVAYNNLSGSDTEEEIERIMANRKNSPLAYGPYSADTEEELFKKVNLDNEDDENN